MTRVTLCVTHTLSAAKKMISDLLNILLPRVLDTNKKVQHAAVSALANIMDDSREFNVDMRPHLDNVINVFSQAANSFQVRTSHSSDALITRHGRPKTNSFSGTQSVPWLRQWAVH